MPAKNYSFAQYIKDEAAKIKRPPPLKEIRTVFSTAQTQLAILSMMRHHLANCAQCATLHPGSN